MRTSPSPTARGERNATMNVARRRWVRQTDQAVQQVSAKGVASVSGNHSSGSANSPSAEPANSTSFTTSRSSPCARQMQRVVAQIRNAPAHKIGRDRKTAAPADPQQKRGRSRLPVRGKSPGCEPPDQFLQRRADGRYQIVRPHPVSMRPPPREIDIVLERFECSQRVRENGMASGEGRGPWSAAMADD